MEANQKKKNRKKSGGTAIKVTPATTENADGYSSSDMDVEREVILRSIKNVKCAPIEPSKRMRVGDIDKTMWILRELEDGERVEDNHFVISKNSSPCAAAHKAEKLTLQVEAYQRVKRDAELLKDVVNEKDKEIATLKRKHSSLWFLIRLSDCLRHLGTVHILPRLQDEYPNDMALKLMTDWTDCLSLLGKGPLSMRTQYQRELQESANAIVTHLDISVYEWIQLYAINYERNILCHEPVTVDTVDALEQDLRWMDREFFLYDYQKTAVRHLIKALRKIFKDCDNTVIPTPTGPPHRVPDFRRKP